MTPRLINRKAASEYIERSGIPCKPATLARYACTGEGPPFRKIGQRIVLYAPEDLDEWIRKRFQLWESKEGISA